MRHLITTIVFVVACFTAVPADHQPVQRNWIGELQIDDRKTLVELKLETAGRPPAGTITFPVRGRRSIALSTLSTEKRAVRFAWPDETEQMIFDGKISNGILAGTFERSTP